MQLILLFMRDALTSIERARSQRGKVQIFKIRMLVQTKTRRRLRHFVRSRTRHPGGDCWTWSTADVCRRGFEQDRSGLKVWRTEKYDDLQMPEGGPLTAVKKDMIRDCKWRKRSRCLLKTLTVEKMGYLSLSVTRPLTSLWFYISV
jgi:hypothetical protein